MVAKSFPVLFVAPESVSEAVLASGLLKKLHDEAPNPRFTIVANRQLAPLYRDMPKVEQIMVTERKASGRRWFGLMGPVRARWAAPQRLPYLPRREPCMAPPQTLGAAGRLVRTGLIENSTANSLQDS